MKRPKPRPEPKRLADLPGAGITCFYCREPKPLAGAARYRAHWVCGETEQPEGKNVSKELTFEQRCTISQQCLPPAPYRDALTVLHTEMLARIAELETEAVGYQAELAGYEHTICHLSALVDELRAPQTEQPAMRGPLTTAEVEQLIAQWDYQLHGDRARYLVREAEKVHGIKPVEIDRIKPSKPTGPVLLWDGAGWVRAEWVERFTEEDQSDGDSFEYDENEVPYVPAGWYELQDHGGDAMKWHIVVPDDAPWMPLPPKPESHKPQGDAQ